MPRLAHSYDMLLLVRSYDVLHLVHPFDMQMLTMMQRVNLRIRIHAQFSRRRQASEQNEAAVHTWTLYRLTHRFITSAMSAAASAM